MPPTFSNFLLLSKETKKGLIICVNLLSAYDLNEISSNIFCGNSRKVSQIMLSASLMALYGLKRIAANLSKTELPRVVTEDISHFV